jgi:predicted DNA-binding protein with PD1-like motif
MILVGFDVDDRAGWDIVGGEQPAPCFSQLATELAGPIGVGASSPKTAVSGAGGTMKSKLINDGPQKTYVLVLDKGDEAVGSIEGFARENRIGAAQLTGIGAFSDAVLGFFDWELKDYRRIPVNEQVEVVSLLGDIALGPNGKPALHPHVVVSRADGIAMGGHLLEAHVRPTLEVVLTESPRHLHKRKDPDSGLALILVAE